MKIKDIQKGGDKGKRTEINDEALKKAIIDSAGLGTRFEHYAGTGGISGLYSRSWKHRRND